MLYTTTVCANPLHLLIPYACISVPRVKKPHPWVGYKAHAKVVVSLLVGEPRLNVHYLNRLEGMPKLAAFERSSIRWRTASQLLLLHKITVLHL